MNEQTFTFTGSDRRSSTGFNHFRRFINNFWLIPILICFLQISTQLMYSSGSPLERFSKGNRAFVQGIPIAYQIATREFPFTLIGHFYEIGMQASYKAGLFQISHEDIKTALTAPGLKQEMYDRMVTSRDHHKSELGGLVSISYRGDEPTLHFYEIRSLNENYLERLRRHVDTPSPFLDLISDDQNMEILEGVGIQKGWIENTATLMKNNKISKATKRDLAENFQEMFEALSESRYLLSPYQFKVGLAKIPLNERFVGIFHFHNGLNEPPSATDIQQSMRNRQIVLTFSNSGLTLYDVAKKDLSKVDIKIDKRIFLE